MTATITGSLVFHGIAGATTTVAPSSEGGLSLSPDFAATLASRTSTSSGAPVATSFSSGRLFGSATSYANTSVQLQQPSDIDGDASETVKTPPEKTDLPVAKRISNFNEPFSDNANDADVSSAPQASLELSAQEGSNSAEPLHGNLNASCEMPDTSSAVSPELILLKMGNGSSSAGESCATISRSFLHTKGPLAPPMLTREVAESEPFLARAEQVSTFLPVNVSLLQTDAGLSLIARVSGLKQSDESILCEHLVRTVSTNGQSLTEMTVNGQGMELAAGEPL